MDGDEGVASRRDFVRAVDEGDVAALEALLRAGLDPNAPVHPARVDGGVRGSRGAWALPLRYAVRGGHLAVVEKLLDAGAAPDVPDASGWTALTDADELGYNVIA